MRIVLLLVLESSFLSMGGAIVGVLLLYVLSFLSQPIVEQHFGLFIPIQPLTMTAYLYVLAVIVAGLLIGFVPALRAYRNSLADGLAMRVAGYSCSRPRRRVAITMRLRHWGGSTFAARRSRLMPRRRGIILSWRSRREVLVRRLSWARRYYWGGGKVRIPAKG